jgi:hypothetical protein
LSNLETAEFLFVVKHGSGQTVVHGDANCRSIATDENVAAERFSQALDDPRAIDRTFYLIYGSG